MKPIKILTYSTIIVVSLFAFESANVVGQGITIQQPTVTRFNVNSAVMVPDGGSMHMGGISYSGSGRTSRGVPGLSNIPYLSRLFRNQSIGKVSAARNQRVFVKVISLREMEEDMMGQAALRRSLTQSTLKDPNGSAKVQEKASFLSRNIGRRQRR